MNTTSLYRKLLTLPFTAHLNPRPVRRFFEVPVLWVCLWLGGAAQGHELVWAAFDSGGGFGAGGTYSLTASIGQPIVGLARSSTYTIQDSSGGLFEIVDTPGAPRLQILHQQGRVFLSWAATEQEFFLESTPALGAKLIWKAWPGPYKTVGDNMVVELGQPSGIQYFRLRQRD